MSVLVKRMKMPNACAECPLNHDKMLCSVTGTQWWSDRFVLLDFDEHNERLPDCPLVELPEKHGDLIDRDALRKDHGMGTDCNDCKTGWKSCEYEIVYARMDFCGWLDGAPIVIEAEDEE